MTRTGDDKDRATAEAARWLVALEEDPDNAELRARFEAWLSASPAHAAAWADTSDIYDMMAQTPPAHHDHWAPYVDADGGAEPAAAARRNRQPPSGPLSHRRRRRPADRRIALGVAAGALAACLAIVFLPSVLLRIEADHVTSTAELRSLTLEDGSRVRLGPDTALAVDFHGTARGVRLLKGQAFFEVAPSPDRDFRVATGELTVTVLGTAFDVRLGDEGAAVAVRHGRVSVDRTASRPPLSQRLDAGDWLRVGPNGGLRRGNAPPDEAGSWLQGQIVSRDRRLAAVVDDLRRYYAGIVILTDETLGERRVSGVYNLDDPIAALRAMAGAHGGVVRQIAPWVLVVSGG